MSFNSYNAPKVKDVFDALRMHTFEKNARQSLKEGDYSNAYLELEIAQNYADKSGLNNSSIDNLRERLDDALFIRRMFFYVAKKLSPDSEFSITRTIGEKILYLSLGIKEDYKKWGVIPKTRMKEAVVATEVLVETKNKRIGSLLSSKEAEPFVKEFLEQTTRYGRKPEIITFSAK